RTKLEDFKPYHTLGKGKFGKVVSAQKQRASGEPEWVAVKEIICKKPNDVKVVLRERMIMERIALSPSPFATQMKFASLVGSKIYFAMDFVEGGDLFTILQNHSISYSGARLYAAEILEALKYLHSLNIVYRDLKPENILVSGNGHLKLADFGLSRIVDEGDDVCYTVCGTAAYFAPELLCSNQGYGLSVDYWQFGCFVYELFVGESPFYDRQRSLAATNMMIKKGEFEFPTGGSRRWKQIVSELLVPAIPGRCGFKEGQKGWGAVAQQPFFDKLDWSHVQNLKYSPPVRPLCAGEDYTKNFDEQF
ncbi:unnamed protein product, partial [Heterosigma akashiwo]